MARCPNNFPLWCIHISVQNTYSHPEFWVDNLLVFSTLKIFFHFLWASIVFDKKSAVKSFFLCIKSVMFFCWMVSRFFYFCVFSRVTVTAQAFCSLCLSSLSFRGAWIYKILPFTNWGNFWPLFRQIFSPHFLPPVFLIMSNRSLRPCVFSFSLCPTNWIISIKLSSRITDSFLLSTPLSG